MDMSPCCVVVVLLLLGDGVLWKWIGSKRSDELVKVRQRAETFRMADFLLGGGE